VISNERLQTLAREAGVTAGLAEKNYVNSWILHAVYESELRTALVFKGGTALSKLYFPELWRFSEDLDFTATGEILPIESRLDATLVETGRESGITFDITNIHRAGDESVEFVRIDVQYDAVLGQQNTTQLEITCNESLAFPATHHRHRFEDTPEFTIRAYSIDEILVEKLRSLYQRARARDYYDIYHLLDQEEFDTRDIGQALQRKARQQDVELDLRGGLPDQDTAAVRDYWDQALDRLVTEKPPFDAVSRRIDSYLDELHQHTESQ